MAARPRNQFTIVRRVKWIFLVVGLGALFASRLGRDRAALQDGAS